MNIRRAFVAAVVLAAVGPQDGWRRATPDFQWTFPRDHWAHPDYQTEWWYQTGHVRGVADSTRRFGYQFTLFRVGVAPSVPNLESAWTAHGVVMGHASIIDLRSGEHVFSEVVYRASELLGGFGPPGDSLIAWSRGPGGNDRRWTITWNGAAFDVAMSNRWAGIGFALSGRPVKPLVFQGPNGFSAKTADGTSASMYYSFTRLHTEGTLTFSGQEYDVVGTSWMDKEFGSGQLAADQIGWDWFSLQLDDDRDLMLYALRTAAGPDYAHATLVRPDGTARYLDRSDWRVTATETWTSPETAVDYPARWTVVVRDDTLDVVPVVSDQENISALIPGLFYWEGAVEVRRRGTPVGQGYVELTGYGDSPVPALSGRSGAP